MPPKKNKKRSKKRRKPGEGKRKASSTKKGVKQQLNTSNGGDTGKETRKKRVQNMLQVPEVSDEKGTEIVNGFGLSLANRTWRYLNENSECVALLSFGVMTFFVALYKPFKVLGIPRVVSGIWSLVYRVFSPPVYWVARRVWNWILTPVWNRIVSPIWTRIVSPIWTRIVSPIWTRAYDFVTPYVYWIWLRISSTGRRGLSGPPTGGCLPRDPCPSDEPPPLPNIGSTCFFNSTLQVILLIKDMLLKTFEKANTGVTHTFHCNEYNEDIVVEITFADNPMTSAFIEFLNAVKCKENIPTALRNLHSRIAERYQRFSSFDQQDSEEVLRCLLDGIRMEEINATRDKIEVVVSKMEKSSDEKQNLIRGAQRKAFRIITLVDTVFGGKCINTVICRECLNPLQLEEPFLDLSVPLPDKSTRTSYEGSNETSGISETKGNKKAECPELVQELLKKRDLITKLISPTTESPEQFSDNLEHCLSLYTTLDVLDEDNKFICDPCTDRLKKEWRDKKQAAKNNKLPPPPPSSSIAVPDNVEGNSPADTTIKPEVETSSETAGTSNEEGNSSADTTKKSEEETSSETAGTSNVEGNSPADTTIKSEVETSSETAGTSNEEGNSPADTTFKPEEETSSETARTSNVEGNSPADTTIKPEVETSSETAGTSNVEGNSSADTTIKPEEETSSETAGTSNVEGNSSADTTIKPEEETSSETARTSNEEGNSSADTTIKPEEETSSETAGTSNIYTDNSSENSSEDKEPEYAECLVSKQLLIHELPPALILHMKRFLLGIPVRKNNLHIDFPGNLDMAPYCTINCEVDPGEDRQIMYDLLGVVQHSGSLHGGHYTAYVKYKCYTCSSEHKDDEEGAAGTFANNKPDSGFGGSGYRNYHYRSMEPPGDLESGKILPASGHHWFHTSDSWKELVRRDDVNRSQAYLLLYVKRHQ